MDFKNKINVVNTMIGSGKTSAAINYINSTDSERFIVLTPYESEVKRYCQACPTKNFQKLRREIGNEKGKRKNVEDLREQVELGSNIISTHSFLREFDPQIMEMCREKNYTLVLDEITDIVTKCEITQSDMEFLQNFADIDSDTGFINWKEDKSNYVGRFSNIKRLCDIGACTNYEKYYFLWLLPSKVLNCFDKVFILTYMFECQPQKYYYDYSKLNYSFIGVEFTDGKYRFSESLAAKDVADYVNLIHILDNYRMNNNGNTSNYLTLGWFKKNKNSQAAKQLVKDLTNFSKNIRSSKAGDLMWTTFKTYKNIFKNCGCVKGYVPLDCRATNNYKDRTSVGYLAERHMEPLAKRFFKVHKIEVDEEKYALSEMLQFIWRSAIRRGNEIWVYVPSARMRTLLENWIEENSNS